MLQSNELGVGVEDNPTISKAAGNVAHVILMFYSCKSYYGIQKPRSKSALAEIFNIIPTSLPFSIWLARMRERGRQPPSAQPCWIIKSEAFKEVTAQGRKKNAKKKKKL